MKIKFHSIACILVLALLTMSFILTGDFPTVKVTPMGDPDDLSNITIDTTTNEVYATMTEDDEHSSVVKWNGKQWNKVGDLLGRHIRCLCFFEGELYAGVYNGHQKPNFVIMLDDNCDIFVLEKDHWKNTGTSMPGSVSNFVVFNKELFALGGFMITDKKNCILKRWKENKWVNCITPFAEGKWSNQQAGTGCIYNNKLVITGLFAITTSNGEAQNIVMWDGESWTSLGFTLEGAHYSALAVYKNELIVGGDFLVTKKPYKSINCILSWDGKAIKSLKDGVYGGILSLAVMNEKLYVGGKFSRAGGTKGDYFAMWDGTEWHAVLSDLGIRPGDAFVNEIVPYDNKLIITGGIKSINKIKVKSAAMLEITN
jgi:hypothetical protein